MNLTDIVAEMSKERDRLAQAIEILTGGAPAKRRGRPPKVGVYGKMSQIFTKAIGAPFPAAPAPKRQFSPATRRKMAASQKRRRAAARKAA
jgi:hypothetical protein